MSRLWVTGLLLSASLGCSALTEADGEGDTDPTTTTTTSESSDPATSSGPTTTGGTTAGTGTTGDTTTSTSAGTLTTSSSSTDASTTSSSSTDASTTATQSGGRDTSSSSSSGDGESSTGQTCESPCDDGEFCNGAEVCDPANTADPSGCVDGPSPCAANIECDEDADECITERRVFATSATYNGDMGGTTGADSRCQMHADAATLGGTWLAYIVDPTSPLNRHSARNVPYVRVDGVRVADNWIDLTDESIQNPINIDENGNTVGGNAWTGMINVGGPGSGQIYCEDWTSDTGGCLDNGICGGAGEVATVDNHWDGFFIFNCSDQYRLYCVEQ